MAKKDEYTGLGSMKIWIFVLLGMAGLSAIVYCSMRWARNNQSLMERVYVNGAFTMGAKAPWGITPEELYPNLRYITGDRIRDNDKYNEIQKLSEVQKDGSFNIVPYETQKYKESELELSARYHMSPDRVLVSGVFASDEDDLDLIRQAAEAYVRAVSALPVEAETPEQEILAVLEAEGIVTGSWTWRAGETGLEIAVRSTRSSVFESGYAGTLEIRIFGPGAE